MIWFSLLLYVNLIVSTPCTRALMLLYKLMNIISHTTCTHVLRHTHVYTNTHICDRVRENQPYVGKFFPLLFEGFCMRIAVWTFAANLKSIARLAAEIWLFLFRVTDNSYSTKQQFLCSSTSHAIFPYTSPFHVATCN